MGGSREELFGSGGGEALAAEVGAPLLPGSRSTELGALADQGEPIVWAEPDADVSRAIVTLAEAIAATGARRAWASSSRFRSSTA